MSKSLKKILYVGLAALMVASAGASVSTLGSTSVSARRIHRSRHVRRHARRHAIRRHRRRAKYTANGNMAAGRWYSKHAYKIYWRLHGTWMFTAGQKDGMSGLSSKLNPMKKYYNNRNYRYGWVLGHAIGFNVPGKRHTKDYAIASQLYHEGVNVAHQNRYARSIFLNNSTDSWDYQN